MMPLVEKVRRYVQPFLCNISILQTDGQT